MEKLEKHILSELLKGNRIEVDRNELQYMSLEFHKQYNLINKMRTQGLPIDNVNLELYALMENQTIDTTYPQHFPELEDKPLQDLIKLKTQEKHYQQKIDKMNSLLNNLKNGDSNAANELQKLLSTTIGKTHRSEVVPISNFYEEQKEFYRNIVDGGTLEGLILWGNNKKNTTQFRGLSNILKRIALTDLVLIGARPSVGKTSFALALMNALYKNDYKPLFISLEMTNGELLQRLATAKAGLSHDLLLSPETPLTPQQMAEYETGLLQASQMDIKLIENPPTSWLEMKQLILNRKDEIDYVIIDHMHIISSYDGTPSQNKNQMYGEISRDMKMLARDHKIPIIVLSQLSREVRTQKGKGGKRIDPSYVEPFSTDLRDSGSLEQDADKILLLYRDKPDEAETQAQYGIFPIICKIEKHRAGKLGRVRYNFNAKTGRWAEIIEKREKKEEDKE